MLAEHSHFYMCTQCRYPYLSMWLDNTWHVSWHMAAFQTCIKNVEIGELQPSPIARRFLPPSCAGFNCTVPPMHTRLEVWMICDRLWLWLLLIFGIMILAEKDANRINRSFGWLNLIPWHGEGPRLHHHHRRARYLWSSSCQSWTLRTGHELGTAMVLKRCRPVSMSKGELGSKWCAYKHETIDPLHPDHIIYVYLRICGFCVIFSRRVAPPSSRLSLRIVDVFLHVHAFSLLIGIRDDMIVITRWRFPERRTAFPHVDLFVDRLRWLYPELIVVDVRILSHLKLSSCSWQNPWFCDCTIAWVCDLVGEGSLYTNDMKTRNESPQDGWWLIPETCSWE